MREIDSIIIKLAIKETKVLYLAKLLEVVTLNRNKWCIYWLGGRDGVSVS